MSNWESWHESLKNCVVFPGVLPRIPPPRSAICKKGKGACRRDCSPDCSPHALLHRVHEPASRGGVDTPPGPPRRGGGACGGGAPRLPRSPYAPCRPLRCAPRLYARNAVRARDAGFPPRSAVEGVDYSRQPLASALGPGTPVHPLPSAARVSAASRGVQGCPTEVFTFAFRNRSRQERARTRRTLPTQHGASPRRR